MPESPQFYIGVNLPARQGVSNQHVVDAALSQGYDLITSRITSRTYRKRVQALYASEHVDPKVSPPIGDDLVIFPGTHVSNTIALCAPWAELDSKDSRIADLSLKVLNQEMAYAKFCGLPYVVIEGPKRRTYLAKYAHSLGKLLRSYPELKIMVHTTFTEDYKDGQPPPDLLSTWEVWDSVRVFCGHPTNLGVALEVQHVRVPEFVVSRWLCEPVMMLVLGEARAFVPNPKSYPVLPKHTQSLVRCLASLQPFLLIKENLGPNKPVEFTGGDDACLLYLRNMLSKPDLRLSYASQQSRTSRHVDAEMASCSSQRPESGSSFNDPSAESVESHCLTDSVADVLEIPLQPLSNPLESGVYEVFESDTTKYHLYFKAICAAISSLVADSSNILLSSITSDLQPLVIAVLGAGRGALVDRVLDAIISTRAASRRAVKLYAVELHAGPVAYLHARKASDPVWDPVEVVQADMRSWIPEQPANLIVSELLGSFGDNELSPECLAHVENNAAVLATNGIMIPQSYTAYAAPVFSPQVWSKARLRSSNGLETPYVVRLRQAELIADPQRVWTFTHPCSSRSSSHKVAKLSFVSALRSRVYGIAGYFEAELFSGISLSTLPGRATPGLNSWFPMFFPIERPIDTLPDTVIDLSIWRERENHRIWYEWAVETTHRRAKTGTSIIHNCDGHAQNMLLS